jgi:ATP-dependent DNA ligase
MIIIPGRFVEPQHPKASLEPASPLEVLNYVQKGWVVQAKMNGRRAQIHVMGDSIIAYTRQGTLHTSPIDSDIAKEILNSFPPNTVLDGEWLPFQKKLFLFDVLMFNGDNLQTENYLQRFTRISTHPFSLPLLKEDSDIRGIFTAANDPHLEGIVLKWSSVKGWPNHAIVRCRFKKG